LQFDVSLLGQLNARCTGLAAFCFSLSSSKHIRSLQKLCSCNCLS